MELTKEELLKKTMEMYKEDGVLIDEIRVVGTLEDNNDVVKYFYIYKHPKTGEYNTEYFGYTK